MMKEYQMIGDGIGIVVTAHNAEEAMNTAEAKLLSGYGGCISFLNKEDEDEYNGKNI